MKKQICILSLGILSLQQVQAEVVCGGDFGEFKEGLRQEAISMGITQEAVSSTLSVISGPDSSVLEQDRRQSSFRDSFSVFFGKRVSDAGVAKGIRLMNNDYAEYFQRAESEYGVPREVITAFWGMESAYGLFFGDFNTVKSLITLAHDCRRPELFRPQVFYAMRLVERGDIDPATMQGAWAGEIGHAQMLPSDIINYGVDADGDGRVNLRDASNASDAILSAASVLVAHGWKRDKPWMHEVSVNDENDLRDPRLWMHSGLQTPLRYSDWKALGVSLSQDHKYMPADNDFAFLVAPEGYNGPKFLVYENFINVFLQWNQSLTNVLTAAHYANMISGNTIFNAGTPDQGLTGEEIIELQTKLDSLGHDVGEIDGIIGSGTRKAVRYYQRAFGMLSDGWPTRELLNKL